MSSKRKSMALSEDANSSPKKPRSVITDTGKFEVVLLPSNLQRTNSVYPNKDITHIHLDYYNGEKWFRCIQLKQILRIPEGSVAFRCQKEAQLLRRSVKVPREVKDEITSNHQNLLPQSLLDTELKSPPRRRYHGTKRKEVDWPALHKIIWMFNTFLTCCTYNKSITTNDRDYTFTPDYSRYYKLVEEYENRMSGANTPPPPPPPPISLPSPPPPSPFIHSYPTSPLLLLYTLMRSYQPPQLTAPITPPPPPSVSPTPSSIKV